MERMVLLIGAITSWASVSVAQSSAPAAPTEENRPVAPFPLTYPYQEVPDTFHMNGIRYITLRPGMPWKQPVNDGKTFYLMQAMPHPRRYLRQTAPGGETPIPAPPEPNEP